MGCELLVGKEVKDEIKRTALYNEHKALGAKTVSFAGWEMPLQYSSIVEEHMTTRQKAGLFDVSHMGQVFFSGKDAAKFLQRLVPQDICSMPLEKAVYTQLLNQNAGIIDDLIIYKLQNDLTTAEERFLLIVNASRIEEDVNWIQSNLNSFNKCRATIDNQSENFSMIALQGPNANKILNDLGLPISEQPKRFFIKETTLLGEHVYVAATGYTGEDGFEIVLKNELAPELWKEILAKGEKYGIKPVGIAARDTLRLEAGLFLYGQDMDENTTPVESSLSWTIDKNKSEDYFGKEKITFQINENPPIKKLIGFRMLDKSIPRHGYEIYINNQNAGIVTSGGVAPFIAENIGLGYIEKDFSIAIGAKIEIKIREKFHPAEIVKRPFYKPSSK